ncbi:kinase [Peribacillus cavernae]|uniref:Kinase n=1 Tax=Peribacillus cavernae TaxID=1674310 RepID=A0A3S0VZA0_9BACI|nr:kinase [Peribacillus cavernae]MDQ0218887.1 RIO-like serine/threonine protein kinase [Peribacillus cavernae]RUQ29391.1 kinase [Peribacillus cavernae]
MKDRYKDFKSITVTRGEGHVEVNNPTDYPLIGKGIQGAVFKLSRRRCVKIYWSPNGARKEAQVMKDGQDSPLMPTLYEVGDNYIVMEYIEGQTLEDIMLEGGITESLTANILAMLDEMKRLNFSRVDAVARHVFITKRGGIKLIDHTNSYIKDSPYPKRLLNRFKRLNQLDTFLDHVERIEPKVYDEWKVNLPDFFKKRQ